MSVNDVLEVNLELLKRVFAKMKKYIPAMKRGPEVNQRKVAKMLNFSNLLEVIISHIPKFEGHFSERKIIKAHFMSKMTVPNENEDGILEYWHLKFVEFLEFICRLAWLKY